MSDDPYWALIDEHWDNILLLYREFEDKEQIIEYDVSERKIYSYPAGDYINTLDERSRDEMARQFAETKERDQFILFVRDTPHRCLRSYVLDLPK
jgi:hypothetical protein